MDDVSNRQLYFLIAIGTLSGAALLDLPAKMAGRAGPGAWFPVALCCALMTVPLGVWIYLGNRFPGKYMAEYSELLLGRPFSKIFSGVYTLYFLLSLALFIRCVTEFVRLSLLSKTPVWAIALVLAAVCVYAGTKSLTNVARLVELCGIVILTVSALIYALILGAGRGVDIQPAFDPTQIGRYFTSTLYALNAFVGIGALSAVPLPAVKLRSRKWYMFGGIASALAIYVLMFEASLSVVGTDDIQNYRNATLVAIHLVKVNYLQILSRLDMPFVIVWLLTVCCCVTLMTLALTKNLSAALGGSRKLLVSLGAGAAVFVLALLPGSFDTAQRYYYIVLNTLGLICAAGIPLLLLLAYAVRRLTRRRRALLALLIPLLSALALTGCWDSKDIQLYNIAMSSYYDKKDGEYELYVEIAKTLGDPKQDEEGDGGARSILYGTGKSLAEARAKLDRVSDNEFFLGVARTITFGRGFAAEGLEEYLNRFRNTEAYRKNVLVFTTDAEDVEELTKVEPDNNVYIGVSVESTLERAHEDGTDVIVNIEDLLQANASHNPCYPMPVVNVAGKHAALQGYAVFRDNKRIGGLTENDVRGMVYLMSDRAEFIYTVPCGDNSCHFYARLKSKKIVPSYRDGKLNFDIDLTLENTFFYSEKYEKFDTATLEQMCEATSVLVRSDIAEAMSNSQRLYGCDYMDFYKYYKAKFPGRYGDIADWSGEYCRAAVNVKVDGVFGGTGMADHGGE